MSDRAPTSYPESIPIAGFGRNGLPIGKPFYVYGGNGHDVINPADCECGKCNRIKRALRKEASSGNPAH